MATTYHLTDEQKKELEPWRTKWLKIGSNCDEANYSEAERGVRLVYQHQAEDDPSITPPRMVCWFRSPKEGAIASAMISSLSKPDKFETTRTETVEGWLDGKKVGVDLAKRNGADCEMLYVLSPTARKPKGAYYRIQFTKDNVELNVPKDEVKLEGSNYRQRIQGVVDRVLDSHDLTDEQREQILAKLGEFPTPYSERIASEQEQAIRPATRVANRLTRYFVPFFLTEY